VRARTVDASVAAKWWLPEADATAALGVLQTAGARVLKAPALLLAEVGNLMWKRVRRGELAPEEAHQILRALLDAPLEICPTSVLIDAALSIALEIGCSVYDGLYVALATLDEAPLITADENLWRRTRGTAYQDLVLRLADAL